jgi:predicted DNA-binding protein YlxM (UPF0122 family)
MPMKTKKEIIQELIERSKESLIRIDIQMSFFQNKHAAENRREYLEKLAELTADKKETEDWVAHLEKQMETAS